MWGTVTAADGLQILARDALLHLAYGQTHRERTHPPDVRPTGDPVAFVVEATLVKQLLPAPQRWLRAVHEAFPASAEAARAVATLEEPPSPHPIDDTDRTLARELVDWVAAKLAPRVGQPFDVRQYFDVYDALSPNPGFTLAEVPSDQDPDGAFGFIPHPMFLIARGDGDDETHPFLRAVTLPPNAAASLQWWMFLHQMNRYYTMDLDALSEELVFDRDSIEEIAGMVDANDADKVRAVDLTPAAWIGKDGLYASYLVFSQYGGLIKRTCRATAEAMQKHDEVIAAYNCGMFY